MFQSPWQLYKIQTPKHSCGDFPTFCARKLSAKLRMKWSKKGWDINNKQWIHLHKKNLRIWQIKRIFFIKTKIWKLEFQTYLKGNMPISSHWGAEATVPSMTKGNNIYSLPQQYMFCSYRIACSKAMNKCCKTLPTLHNNEGKKSTTIPSILKLKEKIIGLKRKRFDPSYWDST